MTLWPELEATLVRAADRAGVIAPARERRIVTLRLRTLALAAAALAAVVVGLSATGNAPAPASAADLLRAAAHAALTQPSQFPRDSQFLYQEIEGQTLAGESTRSGQTVNAQERILTQRWTSARRAGRLQTRILSVRFPSKAAAAAWRANGPVPARGQILSNDSWGPFHGYVVGGATMSRQQLERLPRNPRALFAQLFAHELPQPGYEDLHEFNTLVGTLVGTPLPPWLRSELFTDLSLIPGVRATNATDLLGRKGSAVAFPDMGLQSTVIFDLHSSEILGTRTVAIRAGGGFRKGQILDNLAYTTTRVTNTITTQ